MVEVAQVAAVVEQDGDQQEPGESDHRRDDQASVERSHDPGAAAHAYEEGADDRGNDAHGAEHQRVEDKDQVGLAADLVEKTAEEHGGDRRDRVCLEEVRRHTGAVADVVTHVVRDDRRVARVILRDPGLELADEVRAHVRRLGVDATAESGED